MIIIVILHLAHTKRVSVLYATILHIDRTKYIDVAGNNTNFQRNKMIASHPLVNIHYCGEHPVACWSLID